MASLLKSPNALTQLGTLSGPQWLELSIKHAPQIVMGLAVVGFAWQAAHLTWLLLSPSTVPAEVSTVPGILPQTSNPSIDPQSIANAHLFGVANGNATTDPNHLPQTQMSLVLSGTMALDDPAGGFAIVGENAANAKFYRVGAAINGGARLHSVYADRVIIDRNGSLETLVLPRGAPTSAAAPMVRNVVTTSVGDNLRRIATSNPNALGELLRAQPVFSNGVQKGFRVYPGRDRQQFTRLGLQPGDLVTAVNGTALDDVNRSKEILDTLTTSSTAQVTVERNGTSQQLSLDMATISLPEAAADSTSSSSVSGSPQGALDGSATNRGLRSNRPGGVPAGMPADASAQ